MIDQKDYVSIETAKMLKANGCESANYRYVEKDPESEDKNTYTVINYPKLTLYEAQKWIWEKFGMFVNAAPYPPFSVPLKFFYWIDFPKETLTNFESYVDGTEFPSYQDAFDAGLRKALSLEK